VLGKWAGGTHEDDLMSRIAATTIAVTITVMTMTIQMSVLREN
jgi:hypothetical protein